MAADAHRQYSYSEGLQFRQQASFSSSEQVANTA